MATIELDHQINFSSLGVDIYFAKI